MAWKKPMINKTKTDIQSALIYFRATKKFGKTTLFRDVVLEKFNGDASKGLLIGIGYEQGYTLLDNLNVTQTESWADMEDLKKWLIKEKGSEHNVELLGFDVVGEMLPFAEQEVIRLSKKETGKSCKTFNQAFGGYSEPRNKLKELMKKYFGDLKKAGFGIIAIEHTKVKNIKEKGEEGDGYSVLTSTLPNDYEALFGDIFDFVLTGYVDRQVADGKVSKSERRLYFRSDYFVDAGGRFANDTVPEYITFEKPNMAKDFIEIIEEGMRKSMTNPVSKKEFEKMKKDEIKEREIKAKEYISEQSAINIKKNEELIETIKTNLNDMPMEDMQKIMDDYKFENFSDPESIKTEALEKIVGLLK